LRSAQAQAFRDRSTRADKVRRIGIEFAAIIVRAILRRLLGQPHGQNDAWQRCALSSLLTQLWRSAAFA
jgi:hypothetical protein